MIALIASIEKVIIFAVDLQNNQTFQAILKCIFVTISFDFSSHDRDDKKKLHMHLFNEFKYDFHYRPEQQQAKNSFSNRFAHIH